MEIPRGCVAGIGRKSLCNFRERLIGSAGARVGDRELEAGRNGIFEVQRSLAEFHGGWKLAGAGMHVRHLPESESDDELIGIGDSRGIPRLLGCCGCLHSGP